jgi:hypothetical protein
VVREQDRVIPRKCPWGHVRSRRVVPRRVVRPAPPGTVASGDSGPASTRSMPASSRCTEAERRASGSTPVRGLAARVDAPRISSPVLRRRRTRFGACRAAHPAPVAGTRCGRGRCPAQAVSPVTSVQSASVRPLAKGAAPAVNLPPRSARPPRGASREWAADRPRMRSPLHPRILRGVGIHGRATMIDRLRA